jgi:YD repeat-containing protein
MTYNWAGETAHFVDQNGTTHFYTRDVLGRLIRDGVHIAAGNPQGVDNTVLSLGYSFDDAGRPFQQTSFSAFNGTNPLNQVEDIYNGYGQLITQYQSHSGVVVIGTTPSVGYAYAQPTGANYSRMSSMTYPNSRVLDEKSFMFCPTFFPGPTTGPPSLCAGWVVINPGQGRQHLP